MAGPRAPPVASRMAGASAGASRSASPRRPTGFERGRRFGQVGRPRVDRLVVVPEAECHRAGRLPSGGGGRSSGSRRRLGRRGLLRLDRLPDLRSTIEQRRRRGWRFIGIGRPHARPRHAGEDGVDGAAGHRHRALRVAARLAGSTDRRRRLGSDDQRDRVVDVAAQGGGRGLARPGQVACPPADLGQVDQALIVEGPERCHGLELDPGERQRTEPQVGMGQQELGRPCPRAVGAKHRGSGRHAGNRRRASRPRR